MVVMMENGYVVEEAAGEGRDKGDSRFHNYA